MKKKNQKALAGRAAPRAMRAALINMEGVADCYSRSALFTRPTRRVFKTLSREFAKRAARSAPVSRPSRRGGAK